MYRCFSTKKDGKELIICGGGKHVQIGRIESLQKMAIRMDSRAMIIACIKDLKDIIVSSPSAIPAVVHCWRTVAGGAVLSS